jgi:putative endonuclease
LPIPFHIERGRAAERLAREALERQGYAIEAANVRLLRGELDLIARIGRTLCFIEVRGRAAGRFGAARDTIGWAKRRHLIRAARVYLQRRRPAWTGEVRFDVVAVDYDAAGVPAIQIIPGAFTADG